MDFISGENRNQMVLLPDCVEDYVEEDNTVRVIDAYIDSLNLTELSFSKPHPNYTGRPMYDPKDLLKLYLYGYMNKVRSSRRLETETRRNLELIWLLRKLSPDHKTIARFRRENASALKEVFRDFVKFCTKLNLYGKELIAIDGSKFKAVNSKARHFTAKKLKDKIARIEIKIDEYLNELDELDEVENAEERKKTSEEIARIIEGLKERKDRYETYADELKQTGGNQRSLTDPDSRMMLSNGKVDICYNIQTAVDSKNKMIAEFEVTNDAFDWGKLTQIADATRDILEADNFSVTADAGYNSATDIANCMSKGFSVHVAGADYDICVPTEKSSGQDTFSCGNGRAVFIKERNIAICPMGQALYPRSYRKKSGTAVFYNLAECSKCGCKCTKSSYKTFEMAMPKTDFSKDYNDEKLSVRQIHIGSNEKIVRQRQYIVEHPFGTIKRNMDAGYCLTRGLKNVSGEFALAFLAYNFKRAINIMGARKLVECITT